MLTPKRKLTRRQMKEDKLVTTWFKVYDYLEQHTREILYAIGGVVVIIIAIFFYYDSKAKAEQNASVELARARSEYIKQNNTAAIDILKNLVNNYSGTQSAGIATIYLADAYMQIKDYANAEKYYQEYLDNEDSDPILSVTAATGLAATHDERGNYVEAAQKYEKAAEDYDQSYKAPYLLMNAARCYKLARQPEAVHRVLRRLIDKYPKSALVEDAKLLMAETGQVNS